MAWKIYNIRFLKLRPNFDIAWHIEHIKTPYPFLHFISIGVDFVTSPLVSGYLNFMLYVAMTGGEKSH